MHSKNTESHQMRKEARHMVYFTLIIKTKVIAPNQGIELETD